MRPLSIKLRLSLLVLLLTLAIILVVSVVAYVELGESLLRSVDTILQAAGDAIIATFEEGDSWEERENDFRSIIGNSISRDSMWCRIWIDESEKDLFSSGLPNYPRRASLLELIPEEQPGLGQSIFFSMADASALGTKDPCRALWIRRVREGQVVNVLVGRSSGHVAHELAEFYELLLIVGVSLLLLAFLAAPFFVSWGLRPIARASGQLQEITHKSLRQDREGSETVSELQPFMAALDDMLARLDKAMRQQEQFIADAAHELRTPVAVVKSTLQTTQLQRRTVAEYEESIEETLQDVGRLERLIAQLLSLARLDTPDRLRKCLDIRLDTLLQEVVESFDARAARQNGRVVFPEAAPTQVKGDEIGLRQLFGNLLENALRYGPPGGTVCVTLKDGEDSRVTVSVHDEGGQIPPDTLAHLFDRFYCADSSRSQKSGGSGLGLAIAREIARQHGGDIEMTSDPEAGTLVTVYLPHG